MKFDELSQEYKDQLLIAACRAVIAAMHRPSISPDFTLIKEVTEFARVLSPHLNLNEEWVTDKIRTPGYYPHKTYKLCIKDTPFVIQKSISKWVLENFQSELTRYGIATELKEI